MYSEHSFRLSDSRLSDDPRNMGATKGQHYLKSKIALRVEGKGWT